MNVVNRAENCVTIYRVIEDPSALFNTGAEFPATDVEVKVGRDGWERGFLPTGLRLRKLRRGKDAGVFIFDGEKVVQSE